MTFVMNAFSLPNEPAALKQIIADDRAHIAQLEERVRFLQHLLHGASSEKRPAPAPVEQQHSLFNEAEQIMAEEEPAQGKDILVPAYARRNTGSRPIPPQYPRVEVVHDIPEADKICPCGCQLTRIGEEVSEKLDIVPAKVQVLRHIRPKYACRGCEGVEDDGPTVKTASMPPQLIPQGIASPGLLAHVLIAKFADSLPFYRQETIFSRMGVDVSRATMAGWAIRAAQACEPLVQLLYKEIRSGPIINMDETTVQVLNEPGRKNSSKSYMWLMRGGPPERPTVLFHYDPGRGGKVATELVGNFQGYLQTDGYAGYNALGEREGIVHVGCLAHVRRKFMDVLKASSKKSAGGTAQTVLDLIRELYHLEKQARDKDFSIEQILEMRQEQIKPILDKTRALLVERKPTTPPKSLLGAAINYALGQWSRILVYLEDGRLRPDNNLAENAIRPFAVGRKNWLFSGAPRGAHASATLYSLIETAKANGLEPYAYLRHLFERLPSAKSHDDFKALLPQPLDAKLLGAA